jgi:hypothetical protein
MNLQKELEHRKHMNEDIPAIQEREEMIETFRNDETDGSFIPQKSLADRI